MASQSPKLLLFDLGGVLIEYSGTRDLPALLSQPMTQQQLSAKWMSHDAWLRFELGQLEPEAFAEAFCSDWDLTCTPSEFLTHWESWTRALLPGANDLLDELRPRYRLAALSNSNASHWRRNNEVLGVSALFERAFASHELGLRKPDHAIYEHALSELGVLAAEAVFFDDLAENVDAARQVGMAAHQVRGIDELRACLVEQGLIRA